MDTGNYPIDWSILASAVAFYQQRGFNYVEVPWIIPEESIRITLPDCCRNFDVIGGSLIGSSEQSFLDLDRHGKLSKGRFVACTPCFRDETPDRLHQTTFMKVELYQNDVVDDAALYSMIGACAEFFAYNLSDRDVLGEETVASGIDLTVNGIEVGSYGIRRYDNLNWIFGTGVAEPRFSLAMNR